MMLKLHVKIQREILDFLVHLILSWPFQSALKMQKIFYLCIMVNTHDIQDLVLKLNQKDQVSVSFSLWVQYNTKQ